MISKLKGIIDEIHPGALEINVAGVCYYLLCSRRTLSSLQDHTDLVTIYTEMVTREDSTTLYGFSCAYERDCFRTLVAVQGVGFKVALAILSVAAPGKIFDAIVRQDKSFLTQADGVGPKLAARIVNELKDKVGPRLNLSSPQGSQNSLDKGESQARDEDTLLSQGYQTMTDATSALTNLGFKAFDADRAVRKILDETPDLEVNDVIRGALASLSG